MSWEDQSWKTAAAEYHANRPKLVTRDGGRIINGSDPRANVPPAKGPEELGYNGKPKPNVDAAAFESGRASGVQMTAIEWALAQSLCDRKARHHCGPAG